MDLGPRQYYSELYARPPRRPDPPQQPPVFEVDEAQLADEVRGAISRAERTQLANRGLRLREDAKCLLLLNGQYMIAQPILATGRMEPDELRNALQEDLESVLKSTRCLATSSSNLSTAAEAT
jgi:hypothetical protein